MAFVLAVRNKHQIKVSKKAYENIFKKRGYKLIGEEKEEKHNKVEKVEEPEYTEEVEEMEEVEEETIPISEMNREQLMNFAKENNIDTSSAKSVKEARQIIQKAIRERNV